MNRWEIPLHIQTITIHREKLISTKTIPDADGGHVIERNNHFETQIAQWGCFRSTQCSTWPVKSMDLEACHGLRPSSVCSSNWLYTLSHSEFQSSAKDFWVTQECLFFFFQAVNILDSECFWMLALSPRNTSSSQMPWEPMVFGIHRYQVRMWSPPQFLDQLFPHTDLTAFPLEQPRLHRAVN